MAAAPVLEGASLAAVRHRGSHLQIIAAAGSGKTEVVSQRVAHLLAEGAPAQSVVAFTFTERSAKELKERIALRVEERLGRSALDQIGALFVGTIHSYCFRLLQTQMSRYETYDVLDENQLNAFIGREAHRLDIKALSGKLFASITAFLTGLDVVENELLRSDDLPDGPFRSSLELYLETLERYRLLSYGQLIVRAVRELERPAVRDFVHAGLRHLIVDEYQDVNPAQERLIELLTGPQVELCVVGDDDQAIYQWRGSDVANIVGFVDRYPDVATFKITTNRRSRPEIIDSANRFAETVPDRLSKTMGKSRSPSGGSEVSVWAAEMEQDEAGYITNSILELHERGLPFSDMAVLVRSRAAYQRLLEEFSTFDVPVQPGGRTGLFDQPEARLLGKTLVWLTGLEWRSGYGGSQQVGDAELLDEYLVVFGLAGQRRGELKRTLLAWRDAVAAKRPADLVRDFYELLAVLRVRDWDLDDPLKVNSLGTLARFSSLLADYESVRRRSRADADNHGEQVGGQDRGEWYYRNLGIHVLNYAQGAYDGFDGEAGFTVDAVDVLTVHRAKGLEWPVVFVPSLTANRLPNRNCGRRREWPMPRTLFDAERYEGGDDDERRLFYVAMTRARDWVSLSRHGRVTKKAVGSSPYWRELREDVGETDPNALDPPPFEPRTSPGTTEVALTFSELAVFLECGRAYRLRNQIGFQPRLAPELGYGKAVHHILRTVAEETRRTGKVPTAQRVQQILDSDFFLPVANKPAHRQLKAAAERLVTSYTTDHPDDLHRVWETERPIELHLDGVTVSGRADVILDHEAGVPTGLAILDYKTSTSADRDHALQLRVYADAGRREGLDVRGAYVHDLKAGTRSSIDVQAPAVTAAETVILDAAAKLRARDYTPSPGQRCRTCEVRTVCSAAKR